MVKLSHSFMCVELQHFRTGQNQTYLSFPVSKNCILLLLHYYLVYCEHYLLMQGCVFSIQTQLLCTYPK